MGLATFQISAQTVSQSSTEVIAGLVIGQGASQVRFRNSSSPISIQVRNSQGQPLAGERVRFATPSAGWTATIDGAYTYDAVTDSNGIASAPYPLPIILESYVPASQYSVGFYNISAFLVSTPSSQLLFVGKVDAVATQFPVGDCTSGSPGSATLMLTQLSSQSLQLSISGQGNIYTNLLPGLTLFSGKRVIKRLGDGAAIGDIVLIPISELAPGSYSFQVKYGGTCLIPNADSNVLAVSVLPMTIPSLSLWSLLLLFVLIPIGAAFQRGLR